MKSSAGSSGGQLGIGRSKMKKKWGRGFQHTFFRKVRKHREEGESSREGRSGGGAVRRKFELKEMTRSSSVRSADFMPGKVRVMGKSGVQREGWARRCVILIAAVIAFSEIPGGSSTPSTNNTILQSPQNGETLRPTRLLSRRA